MNGSGWKKQWHRRWQKWLSSRMPGQSVITLHRGNIFILPSAFGMSYLLLCLFIFILGTNYQNNLVLLLSMLLFSLFMSCMLRCYQNLAGIDIRRTGQGEHFAGQPLPFTLLFKADTPHYHIELNFEGQRHTVIEELQQQREAIIFCQPQGRGYFDPGRLRITSRYPLALFKAWTELDFCLNTVVYPEPIPAALSLKAAADSQEIDAQRSNPREGDELVGLRNYRQGESLNRVAWKQLAQGRGMMSKAFELPQGRPLWLELDENDVDTLELQLSRLCSQVLELSHQQQTFGLKLATEQLPPGNQQAHRQRALSMLALYPRSRFEPVSTQAQRSGARQ